MTSTYKITSGLGPLVKSGVDVKGLVNRLSFVLEQFPYDPKSRTGVSSECKITTLGMMSRELADIGLQSEAIEALQKAKTF